MDQESPLDIILVIFNFMKKQEVFIGLVVNSGYLLSHEIIESVGYAATKKYDIGQRRSNTNFFEKRTHCFFSHEFNKSKDIQDNIHSFLMNLSSQKEKILSLSKGNEVFLSIAIYFYVDDIPILYFKNNILRQLKEFGIGLDIDLFPNIERPS